MVGAQRAPLLGDPWRTALTLERRMLSAIDAIVALGPAAIAYLEPLVRDAPVSDPAHAFAIGMTLGCLAGRDSLAAVERILFAAAPAEPDWIASFAPALKVAPHDALPLSLRTLLRDGFAGHRALAIDVLGYRGLVTSMELAAASTDAPEVFAAALPYLALTADPLLRTVIDAALAEGEILCSATLSGSRWRSRATLVRARCSKPRSRMLAANPRRSCSRYPATHATPRRCSQQQPLLPHDR